MMWRYAVGGVAALLMVGAGWLIFNGEATAPTPAQSIAAPRSKAEVVTQMEDNAFDLPEAPARSREQKRFDRYDKDRNGRVSREEYLASRHKAFTKLDVDGDGRLSFDEWAIKTTTRFAAADRDRSNTMDPREFATTAPKRKASRPTCRCPTSVGGED